MMGIFHKLFRPDVQRMKDRGDITGLIKALKHKQSNIRRSAAESLGQLDDRQAIKPLIEALCDEDRATQMAAVNSLGLHRIRETATIAPKRANREAEEGLDQRVIDWICNEFKCDYGIDLRTDHIALQRLKCSLKMVNEQLSSLTEVDLNLPFITSDASGPKHLRTTLTRAKLDQLTTQPSEPFTDRRQQTKEDSQPCRYSEGGACNSLRSILDDASIEKLDQLLDEGRVNRTTVEQLEPLVDEEMLNDLIVQLLVDSLADEDSSIRQTAADALVEKGSLASSQLIALLCLKDLPPHATEAAVRILGEIHDRRALGPLVALLMIRQLIFASALLEAYA